MTDHADRLLDELITAAQAGRRFDGVMPADGELARKLVREAEALRMDAHFAAQLESDLFAPRSRSSWRYMPLMAAAVLALILAGGALLFGQNDGTSGVHVTDIGGAGAVQPDAGGGSPNQDRPSERMGKIALSPDHSVLAQGGCSQPAGANCLEGQVRFWDVETRQLIPDQTVTIGSMVAGVAYSPNGQWLAISGCAHNTEEGYCDQSQVWLWSPESGEIERQLPEPSETVISQVHFDGESQRVLATSIDGTLFVWDLEADQVATHSFFQYHSDLTTAAFSADGKIMAFQDENHAFWFWNVEQGQIVGQAIMGQDDVAPAMAISSVTYSDMTITPASYTLITADQNGSAWQWEWSPMGELVKKQLACHYDVFTVLATSPQFARLISGGADGTVCRWDYAAVGQWIGKLIGRSETDSPVVGIAFSADDEAFAVVHLDNTISVWDISDHPSIDWLGRMGE